VQRKSQLQRSEPRKHPNSSYAALVTQYTALHHLRKLKSSDVDDSNVIHLLANNELTNEQFVSLDADAWKRMQRIIKSLQVVLQQRAVSKQSMQAALTAEQHAAYIASYNTAMSPAEEPQDDTMPALLHDYEQQIKLGGTYTTMAAMHRGRNVQKRDAQGRTAAQRYTYKAEAMYESAIMLLTNVLDSDRTRNPNYNSAVAGDIAKWLDRDVSVEPGEQPAADQQSVPRIRGSSSRYCMVQAERMWGAKRKRYWRQREALVSAALLLLYGDAPASVVAAAPIKRTGIQRMLQNINSEKD
jgi:hypothetical protein